MAVARTSPLAAHDLPATRLALLDEPLRLYRGGVIEHPVIAYEALGHAERGAGQHPAAVHRALAVRARGLVAGRPEAGLVGVDDRRGQAHRHFALLRRVRQFARQPVRLVEPGFDRSCAPGGLLASPSPKSRSKTSRAGATKCCASSASTRWHAVAGPSMGGMTVLAFARSFPASTRTVSSRSPARRRANPFAIALRSLQREIVRNDPAWRGGNYEPGRGPRQGMRMARKLGTITYRSHEEWDQRFGRRRVAGDRRDSRAISAPQFEVESYLEHQGAAFRRSLRRQLLPVPVARDGPVRPRRARRRLARRGLREVRGVQRALVLGVADRHAVSRSTSSSSSPSI